MSRTEALLTEIARKGSTRASIAAIYGDGIRANMRQESPDFVDWPTVNAALLDRYSVSGLNYIKALAWNRRLIVSATKATKAKRASSTHRSAAQK